MSPSWGNYYWPFFLVLVSALFGVPELIALFTNVANTLSDYARLQLHVGTAFTGQVHTVAWWASLAAWLLFAVVITVHIWFVRFPG